METVLDLAMRGEEQSVYSKLGQAMVGEIEETPEEVVSQSRRRRWTEQEDKRLAALAEEGTLLSAQAAYLGRTVGSVKSRRRILGLSEPRASMTSPTEADPEAVFAMRRLVIYFFGGAMVLSVAALLSGIS